jgi:cobalamin biosynthesis protein CobW
MDRPALARVETEIATTLPRSVKIIHARDGQVDPAVALGLEAAAEDDLAARPSHHDAEDGEHEHDDFESFIVELPEIEAPEDLLGRLQAVVAAHPVFRIKGFVPVRTKPLRLLVQGVGERFRHQFDRPWRADEERRGRLVVIGESGLDRAAIEQVIGA